VLVAAGGLYGGYSLYVEDNRLVYEYNAYNEDRFLIRSDAELPEGEVELKAVYEVNQNKTGTVTLLVNGEQVGQGQVSRTHPGQFSLSETFDVGEDTGTPVSRSYTRENAFAGRLDKVVVALEQD
jgi:arylsulfatase